MNPADVSMRSPEPSGFITPIGYYIFISPLKWVIIFSPLAMVFAINFGIQRLRPAIAQVLFWLFAALVAASAMVAVRRAERRPRAVACRRADAAGGGEAAGPRRRHLFPDA